MKTVENSGKLEKTLGFGYMQPKNIRFSRVFQGPAYPTHVFSPSNLDFPSKSLFSLKGGCQVSAGASQASWSQPGQLGQPGKSSLAIKLANQLGGRSAGTLCSTRFIVPLMRTIACTLLAHTVGNFNPLYPLAQSSSVAKQIQ